MTAMEIEWWRLKAPELRALAAREAIVIVPVASTEQHGPHLPTQVDCLLVGEIARRAATRASASTPTLITPTGLERPRRASYEPRRYPVARLR